MPAQQFNVFCTRQRIGLPTVGEVRAKLVSSGVALLQGPKTGLSPVFLIAAEVETATALKTELNMLQWTVEPKDTPPLIDKLPRSEDQSNVIRFPLHRRTI